MSQGNLAKVEAATAAEVCRRYIPSEEARSLLRVDFSPRQFLEALTEKGRIEDACRFLAHALPAREAVWWGCLCVGQSHGPAPAPASSEALKTAKSWAASPTEANRRAAMTASEAAGADTPAGSVALAAFFSGGSIAPDGMPPVPPPEAAAGKAIAGAVLLAALLKEPEHAPEKLASFLKIGIDVAEGANRWPESAR